MTTPESRAATAAIGTTCSSWSMRMVSARWRRAATALLNLSALLLSIAAAQKGMTPRELLMQIALIVAWDH